MREIKFRIWDDLLKMLYTPEMDKAEGNLWEIPTLKGGVLKIENAIVMQYTGLKDKNGKEIFEGDILHFGRYVVNEIGEDSMEYVDVRVDWDYELLCEFKYDCEDENNFVEIIGNVHENPELL